MNELIRPRNCPEVLVVDDEQGMRRFLELAMRHCGFSVKSAGTGQAAVELYRQCSPPPDVVLLDVQMPGMDGPATLAALQEFDPDVRCCFMSGGSDEYDVEDLLALGAAHFFPKPFPDLHLLGKTLSEVAHGELVRT
jgi:CheY-like chemotaxis protein